MISKEVEHKQIYLGPYQIIGKIEEGTQSKIFLGKNQDKLYGVKVYKYVQNGSYNFQKEVEMLCNLNDKMIIKPLQIFHFLQPSGEKDALITNKFFVMQYYKNGDLRKYISLQQTPRRVINTLIRNIAKSLLALQINGIIHRDIKPQNFIIDSSYQLKLIDFGLAAKIGQTKQQLVGTSRYIAPEVHISRNYSYKSDIFALGVILFEMVVVGVNRFPFKVARITDGNYLLFKQKLYDQFWTRFHPCTLDRDIKVTIQKLLAPNPMDRPTASDVLQMEIFKNQATKQELSDFFQRGKSHSQPQFPFLRNQLCPVSF